MPKANVYSNAMLLEAITTHSTIEAAAQSVGCSKRTLYSRMQDATFRAQLTAFRAERIRTAAAQLDTATEKAIEALTGILDNPDSTDGDKIRAATLILDSSPKYAARLESLESRTAAAGESLSGLDILIEHNDLWKDLDKPVNDAE